MRPAEEAGRVLDPETSEGVVGRENGPPLELILVEGVMVLGPAPVCRCSGQPNDTMTPLAKMQHA